MYLTSLLLSADARHFLSIPMFLLMLSLLCLTSSCFYFVPYLSFFSLLLLADSITRKISTYIYNANNLPGVSCLMHFFNINYVFGSTDRAPHACCRTGRSGSGCEGRDPCASSFQSS